MESSETARAAEAATSVARALGLAADGAVILNSSNKLALRLTPCDVLARVSHAGEEVAQLELDRAQRLAAAGCPVGVVEPSVPPRGARVRRVRRDALDLLPDRVC